jgi:hypothetical protein
MADELSNRLPWAEAVSCVSLSDASRARAAQRFFDHKRFASQKNFTKRGLVRRLVNVVFDVNLSIIDIAQQIGDEIRGNSDAKALNACVQKIEQLGEEGWHRTAGEDPSATLRCGDLDVQLQPNAFLTNKDGRLLLYAYFRRSPPLSTDAIRALLCLVQLSTTANREFQNARIVVLDCYNDKSYEGSDFQEGEPWIARQMDRVFRTYNEMFRIHLDGSPPSQLEDRRRLTRRPRAIRADRAGFSFTPSRNQLCFQFV